MTALDLTPAAGAAPRGRRIARHAAMESALTLRNGEQLLLALVIPVGVLVAGRLFGTQFGLDPQILPASVLALALWSSAMAASLEAQERERPAEVRRHRLGDRARQASPFGQDCTVRIGARSHQRC